MEKNKNVYITRENLNPLNLTELQTEMMSYIKSDGFLYEESITTCKIIKTQSRDASISPDTISGRFFNSDIQVSWIRRGDNAYSLHIIKEDSMDSKNEQSIKVETETRHFLLVGEENLEKTHFVWKRVPGKFYDYPLEERTEGYSDKAVIEVTLYYSVTPDFNDCSLEKAQDILNTPRLLAHRCIKIHRWPEGIHG